MLSLIRCSSVRVNARLIWNSYVDCTMYQCRCPTIQGRLILTASDVNPIQWLLDLVKFLVSKIWLYWYWRIDMVDRFWFGQNIFWVKHWKLLWSVEANWIFPPSRCKSRLNSRQIETGKYKIPGMEKRQRNTWTGKVTEINENLHTEQLSCSMKVKAPPLKSSLSQEL